jgi:signal transduction histidine kinase
MRSAAVLLCLLLQWVGTAAGATHATESLDHAEARVHPDGETPHTLQVPLRHRWDSEFPGRDGTVVYTLQLPPMPQGSAAQALLIDRAGNQIRIEVDGEPLMQVGSPEHTGVDAGKRPHLVPLPDTASVLRIEARMQALRGGGLSPVWIGPRADIEALHATRHLLDQQLPAMYATGLLLMGGLALGLWWRLRDPLYGSFGLASLLGALHHLNRIWYDVPIPWPLWGAVLAVAFGLHLALIARFVVLVTQADPLWLRRTTHATVVATAVLATLSFLMATPWLWTAALVLLEVMGVCCFAVVLRAARRHQDPTVWWVFGAGTVVLATGLHDILAVRTGAFGLDGEPLVSHALFFFVVLLAGIVVARYSASVAQVAALNQDLSRRVAEREAQLREAFETLRAQREEQVAAQERQRIMRDIHDGVGSQLVGLLSLVRRPVPDRAQLEHHVEVAMDELRMAVDSLQPVHGDLATVLATLRYRLQPRLQAAGLRIVWDVAPLPPLAGLSPQAVLQVQRILLEAFTNVLRHAAARSVTVRAHCLHAPPGPSQIVLSLLDDGIGIGAAPPAGGQGLASMRARAAAIGVTVDIEPGPAGGTCVTLRWPLPAAPAAIAGAPP